MSHSVTKTMLYLNELIGHMIPWRIRNRLGKWLYQRGALNSKILTIDLTGSCNLRCPSCPVGSIGQTQSNGAMDLELFKQIIVKAKREHSISVIALHNWTEPFLHPELPAFIRFVKSQKLICALSTNLTIRRNIEEVIAAQPDFLRISLSGFYQESYGKTHVRGNIEHVKQNMRLLSKALANLQSNKTCVTVFYHKYRHNLEEMHHMQNYATELGFEWEDIWAYYMSLEKVLQLVDGDLDANERAFIEHFALPIDKAIDSAKAIQDHTRCSLLENQIVIDYQGNVNLCCAVYDTSKNRLGNFLDMDLKSLVQAKSNHPTCSTCTKHNLHLYFTYYEIPELKTKYETLASANIDS